jgi:hypothetical protein
MTLALVMVQAAALAQDIQIRFDPQVAAATGIDAKQYEDQLRDEMSSSLSLEDQEAYMVEMANATAMAIKGMGVDYASNPQRVVVGYSFGSAVNASGAHFGWGDGITPTGGFSFQMAAMAGINFGLGAREKSAARRFLLYGNGFVGRRTMEPFDTSLSNFGAHLQIKLVRPKMTAGMGWGGFDLTSGFEQTTYTMGLTEEIPLESGKMTWNADGSYEIESKVNTIPIELSTNVKVPMVSIFGGGAVDINLSGDATSSVRLEGPIEATVDGQTANIGTASASLDAAGLADSVVPRVFLGAQLNLWKFRTYGQLNVGLNDSFGGHVGARLAI